MGILDNAGNLVVDYKYNVWGRPISTTGSLADTLGKLNPYRFRGYVWDDETGLYHLRSRLYNPETGRFINEDGVIVNSILGKNIFCYGWNNSTIHVDSAGTIALSALAVKAVIGACTAAAESIASDLAVGNRISVFGVIKDAALGAVTSLIPSRIVSGLVSFAVNTVDYLWECKTEEKTVDGTVIIWEGVGTFAGELLGAGFEHGKKPANKTVDKIVQGVYETGINVAISGVGKQMKKRMKRKHGLILIQQGLSGTCPISFAYGIPILASMKSA